MSTDSTAAALRGLYDRWFASIPKKDASFVDRSMHADLVMVTPEGARLGAAGYKAMYKALPVGCDVDYRIEEFHVRPLAGGAAAMVTGVYHSHILHGETVLSDKSVRFISVWERVQDQWILHAHQLTELPAE